MVCVEFDAQREGEDVLLCGQVPPDELLAERSIDLLNAHVQETESRSS